MFCGQRYRVRALDLSAIEVPCANDGFLDLVSVVAERLRTRQLAPILSELARLNGFDCISYTCWMPRLAGESTYWVFGPLPNETRIAYHSRNMLETDEVVRHCKTSHVPAVWRVDDAGLKTLAPDLHLALSDSYRSRISFPVHGPYREWGAVSFNSRLADVWAALQTRRYQMLCEGQLLAQYIHHWVTTSGLLWDLSEQGTVALKDKEKEILRLGALGFESHEIAPLAGMSKRAIDYVFQQITRKLQVTNRQEAITAALELGLITL
jgi:DNA-binding CsgD family transcriptional regulator